MSRYAFLSDEWVEAARGIRAEYAGQVPSVPVSIRMNQVIKKVPFGTGVLDAHLDTSSGQLDLETGHLDKPDLTITVDYDTARALLIDADAEAAMQAFMSGRIKVDGDISKLLELQSSGLMGAVDPVSLDMARRIHDITE